MIIVVDLLDRKFEFSIFGFRFLILGYFPLIDMVCRSSRDQNAGRNSLPPQRDFANSFTVNTAPQPLLVSVSLAQRKVRSILHCILVWTFATLCSHRPCTSTQHVLPVSEQPGGLMLLWACTAGAPLSPPSNHHQYRNGGAR